MAKIIKNNFFTFDKQMLKMDGRFELLKFNEEFFELSKKWLSDPQIKRLTMTPDVSAQSQGEWFSSLENRNDYYIKGISVNGEKIGAVGLKHIDHENNRAEYWGYIGEKSYIGHGIGKIMVKSMIDECKSQGISHLYLKVADYNERAICLYRKMGFKQMEKYGNTINMCLIIPGRKGDENSVQDDMVPTTWR